MDAFSPGIEVGGPARGMHFGEQGIEDPDVVTGVEYGRDDRRSDEAGSTGDEDSHSVQPSTAAQF